MHNRIKTGIWILLLLLIAGMIWLTPTWTPAAAQQPTGNIPTVTGTAIGPFITVTSADGANVRAGPSSFDYEAIGFLVPEETAPALGRSPGKDWIEIAYPGAQGGVGWVYTGLVSLSSGAYLPVLEPPPTTTPRTTPTINPTFAAAFQVETTATRLPTFTAPPPIATLDYKSTPSTSTRIPMGFVILGLALIGILGAVISFVRGR
jgi:hypothetical protein